MTPIQKLTADFVTAIEAAMVEHTNGRLADVLRIGLITPLGGVRPKSLRVALPGRTTNGRRKGPIQLCPVPRCRGRAAPVFGMVCASHRHVPKATIAKYREARRAKKARRR